MKHEQPFETFCLQVALKHYLTRTYRPQTNGKVEAFLELKKRVFQSKLLQGFK